MLVIISFFQHQYIYYSINFCYVGNVFFFYLQRFYKYNELKSQREAQKRLKDNTRDPKSTPYWEIFVSCFPQCLNVFLTFFTTLAVFPAVHSGRKVDQVYCIYLGDEG